MLYGNEVTQIEERMEREAVNSPSVKKKKKKEAIQSSLHLRFSDMMSQSFQDYHKLIGLIVESTAALLISRII